MFYFSVLRLCFSVAGESAAFAGNCSEYHSPNTVHWILLYRIAFHSRLRLIMLPKKKLLSQSTFEHIRYANISTTSLLQITSIHFAMASVPTICMIECVIVIIIYVIYRSGFSYSRFLFAISIRDYSLTQARRGLFKFLEREICLKRFGVTQWVFGHDR